MPIWTWSKTASADATADPTINWAEGQAPSTVNDSARGMMAATAQWRDDISGTITTGGASTAYTVISNSSFTSLAALAGQLIAFIPHTTNTSDTQTTLSVDGLAAKPIRFAPGVEIKSGHLVLGAVYLVSYNNVDGAFYLIGNYNAPASYGLFKVTLSGNQSATASTRVKLALDTKIYDREVLFNTSTNRFIPLLPGYYSIFLKLDATFTATKGPSDALIRVNGSDVNFGTSQVNNSSADISQISSAATSLVFLNGSTDYVEGFIDASNSTNTVLAADTYMMGYRVSP